MQQRTIIAGGKRVAVAEMLLEDQPYFHRWLADNPELRSLIDDPHVPTLQDQLRWFERVQKPDRRMFSIVTLPDMQLIGNGGFVDIDAMNGTSVFRITIGNPAAWGQGYGTEAVRLLLSYGFRELHMNEVHLCVRKTNERAIRTYQRAGFDIDTPAHDAADPATLRMSLTHERFHSFNGKCD